MNINCDVLIAGSGVAGLYCALNLDSKLDILVITKSSVDNNNTYLAQGGISTARDNRDIELFVEDTLKAGKYKNKLESVNILAKESIQNINQIISYGMNFDKVNDEISYTREGAHSINRIVHSKDKTGQELFNTLLKEVKKRNNIKIYEHTYLLDIINKDNKCFGGVVINNDKLIKIYSKVTVLATGGIGGLFKNSTSQRHLTGDGIAIAIKNNIYLKDVKYIQIHPTAFYEDYINDRRLLISEAVRGEGGTLLNSNKERFVDELLPRDIVTKYINKEMKKDKSEYVYLDITHKDKDYIKNRFTFIYDECLKKGVDITSEYIKVSPAQHYFMGGIDVDINSRTSMDNLYAVGEVSCTGVHGANRLASNSLLEGLVFSKRAAKDINLNIDNVNLYEENIDINYKNINLYKEQIEIYNKELVINKIKNSSGEYSDELFSY